ncbi:hypothetical protein AWB80_08461 [Caballeronia pedi]|uniref:DUF3307 domain-containing protein n=1 Tax=Caballeronia pedi TaxID=1777141 RepID=A0A158EAF1_9BURK|nr:DUF3307 domain-containing protein [Caballeronia pedi]SAL02887.1 hypothetical protein AWB80_08461 [Caballeronia pedi]
MIAFLTVLFWLVVGHSLADYPLQGDFLAQGKNRHTKIGAMFWPHCLFAHSMVHAGFVALVTGSIALGVCEAIVHAVTDFLKCEEKIGMRADQTIHFACKALWAAIAVGAFA